MTFLSSPFTISLIDSCNVSKGSFAVAGVAGVAAGADDAGVLGFVVDGNDDDDDNDDDDARFPTFGDAVLLPTPT